jgi:hypothetical protein
MKYMLFVPWAKGSPSTFGEESNGGKKNPRMNWSESADDKEFTIVIVMTRIQTKMVSPVLKVVAVPSSVRNGVWRAIEEHH